MFFCLEDQSIEHSRTSVIPNKGKKTLDTGGFCKRFFTVEKSYSDWYKMEKLVLTQLCNFTLLHILSYRVSIVIVTKLKLSLDVSGTIRVGVP